VEAEATAGHRVDSVRGDGVSEPVQHRGHGVTHRHEHRGSPQPAHHCGPVGRGHRHRVAVAEDYSERKVEEDLGGREDVLLEELVEAAEDQDDTDGLPNYGSAIEALLEAVQMNVLVLLDRGKKTLLWGEVIRETIRFVQAFLPLFSFSISLRHILVLSRHLAI